MESLARILADHPFLQGLEPAHLELIVGCASNIRFDEGQYLFREGEEANSFYIVRQGRVALQIPTPQRGPLTIYTVRDGDVLGWSWVFPPYRWYSDARALELTRTIALDGACLRRKCEEDHHLGYELMKRFARLLDQSLRASRLQLLDVYATDRARA